MRAEIPDDIFTFGSFSYRYLFCFVMTCACFFGGVDLLVTTTLTFILCLSSEVFCIVIALPCGSFARNAVSGDG